MTAIFISAGLMAAPTRPTTDAYVLVREYSVRDLLGKRDALHDDAFNARLSLWGWSEPGLGAR